MHRIFSVILLFAAVVSATSPPAREYFALQTELVSGQKGKEDFDNLWATQIISGLETTYIGFSGNELDTSFFWRNKSSVAPNHGKEYFNIFTQLQDFPAYYVDQTALFFPYAWGQYSSLLEAHGSTAQKNGTFFFDSTGLQWFNPDSKTTGAKFKGWLVCDWFYGKELFWRSGSSGFEYKKLPNCAQINLKVVDFPQNGTDAIATGQKRRRTVT